MFTRTQFAIAAALTLVLSACSGVGDSAGGKAKRTPNGEAPGPSIGIVNGVVKVQAAIPVVVDASGAVHASAVISNPVTIVNPTKVDFSLNSDGIVMPTIENAMLYFGKLAIGELFDNNLRVCGANGRTRCSKAYIQIYTTGTPQAGLWNADDQWGAPIYANQTGDSPKTVGLDAANAAVVQIHDLSASKNVLRLSDFTSPAEYEMRVDFTDAGAGSYTTTLVVEYGLLD